MFADDILLFFSGFSTWDSLPSHQCCHQSEQLAHHPWTTNEHKKDTGYICPAKGSHSQRSSWHSCDVQLSSTSACDSIQVSWCVFRQSPQLGGSDLAHHQESLPKDRGLVTRWSATDVTCKTIFLHGHHCCRHWIWFKRLLFISFQFHRIEGKAYLPLQA